MKRDYRFDFFEKILKFLSMGKWSEKRVVNEQLLLEDHDPRVLYKELKREYYASKGA